MRNLYIDFDGVIMDTITTMNRIIDESGIDKNNEIENERFYKRLDWNHVLQITPEINHGMKSVQKILDKNIYDVAILTHVNSIHEIVEKVNFIRQFLGDITIIPVPKRVSKTKMVRAKDAILVDDYSGNLKEWEDAGGIGIRFNLNLDSKGFRVINSLDQLLEMDLEK